MFDEPLPCDEPVESGCTDESAVEAGAALEAVETAQAAGALTESDAAATLAAAAASQRELNLVGARQLATAAHWADLHGMLDCAPALSAFVGDPHGWGGEARSRRKGREVLAQPGGEGTPKVAEFAPAELGAVLGISTMSAGTLIADSLDLRHRLPLLWTRVQSGTVKIWVARRIAQRTRRLPQVACARVDVKVAPVAATLPYGRLEKVLDAAILAADPDQAAADTQATDDSRGVWVGRDVDHGVASVFARADAPDIAAFDKSLDTVARALRLLGDDATHDVRRAKALGVLANPQAAIELVDTAEAARRAVREAAEGAAPAGTSSVGDRRRCTLGPATLYVHVSRQALTDGGGVARVEDLGPALLEQVRGWLGDRSVRLQPVLGLDAVPAVDCYEVPTRLADAIRLHPPAGFFPFSCSLSRHDDNEHTTPYLPPDDGGPPGQTSMGNLAHTRRH
ncbi:MAG: DUF222 domain-containing protein, partial [Nocardioidaceae bacterium]